MNKEALRLIEQETRRLFEKLDGVETAAVAADGFDGSTPTVTVSVKVAEPKMLIGEKGQTLFEIQHVLKLMLRKKIAEPFYLALDVNEYKKNKEEYIRDLAQTTADEVALLKKEKELPPMPSAERRMVHVALANRSDVVSESIGEGPDRRVVIRLKPPVT